MKYLRKFNTEAEIKSWQMSTECVNPNVVLSGGGGVWYNVPKMLGVFIQHIDGNLYTTEDWTAGGFTNDEANGVAVITAKASFVIAKNDLVNLKWSSSTAVLVDGILTTSDETTALTDFAGYDNTQLMLATDTSGAGYSCANYTFPNGNKGYLPALGELKEAYDNQSKIDSLMTKIGGDAFSSYSYYWSSTQYSHRESWKLDWKTSSMRNNYKGGSNIRVRAFSTL